MAFKSYIIYEINVYCINWHWKSYTDLSTKTLKSMLFLTLESQIWYFYLNKNIQKEQAFEANIKYAEDIEKKFKSKSFAEYIQHHPSRNTPMIFIKDDHWFALRYLGVSFCGIKLSEILSSSIDYHIKHYGYWKNVQAA